MTISIKLDLKYNKENIDIKRALTTKTDMNESENESKERIGKYP